MTNNKLQMPASYVALNENEKSCVEGGGIVSQVFYAFGDMLSGVHGDFWKNGSQTTESSKGAVITKGNEVYTTSGSTTQTTSSGSSWGFSSLGNFFYGVGKLFAAFGL